MAVLLQMAQRREIKQEGEQDPPSFPSSSALPSTLHRLMYNEPLIYSEPDYIEPTASTSAARSTLRDSHSFPLRPVPQRYSGPYSPGDDYSPGLSLSVPHSHPSLTPSDRQPSSSPHPRYSSYFSEPHRSYAYSPEPIRGRRAGSYPRQLSPREHSESDYHSPHSSQYPYERSQYVEPYARRESHSLPRIGPPSPRGYRPIREHGPYPSSSSSHQLPSDNDTHETFGIPHRSQRRRPHASDDDDEYNEPKILPVKRARVPKKVQVACNFCRGRKLRCDGGQPTCWNCSSRNIRCEYVEVLKRRGPGKTPKGNRAKKRTSSTSRDETSSPLPSRYNTPTFDPEIHRHPRTPPPFLVGGRLSYSSPPDRNFEYGDHRMRSPSPPLHAPPFSYPPPPAHLLHPSQSQGPHPSSYPLNPPPGNRYVHVPRRSSRTRANMSPTDTDYEAEDSQQN